MKYTPGPWKVKNVPSAGWEIFAEIPELKKHPNNTDGYVIWKLHVDAHIAPSDQPQSLHMLGYEPWVQFPPKWWIEMTEANARLIAAAPELLEALEELYRQTFGFTGKFHPNSLLGEALTKAKQAIAKAKD